MAPKTKASITTEFVRVDSKPAWLIRGFTTGIKDILAADGATWDGQRIGWVYTGATLPPRIKQAIDGVLGQIDPAAAVKSPEAEAPATKPVPAAVVIDRREAKGDPAALAQQADELAAQLGY